MKDTLINADFTFEQFNSIELANNIKSFLNKKGVNYKDFNANLYNYHKEEVELKLPLEAYEYQNFAVLKSNDDYILLDGFRRLLWSDSVDHNIMVRVYDINDLSDEQILRVLVSLNHTKFFSGLGQFYDRGFALAMKMIFDINITKFYKSFDGYLTSEKFKYDWLNRSLSGDLAHKTIVEKIVAPHFLDDMRFLEKISENEMFKSDLVFGGFIYNLRETNPTLVLSASDFIEKVKANKILLNQIASFFKAKDSRGNDIGNKMFEMFTNIILNKDGEKSFLEKESEVKDMLAKLKKDKKWYCYTNSKKIMPYDFWQNPTKDNKGLNTLIIEYQKENGYYPKVKVLVFPSENQLLEYGENDDFKITGFTHGNHLMSNWSVLDVKNGEIQIDKSWRVDNRHDLSIIKEKKFGLGKENKVYLFIENIFV